MSITAEDAFGILELPCGADFDSVRTSYKRLALRWHPDKHKNSNESLQKFKEINVAYKCITDPTFKNEQDMSMDTMFNLFQEVFFSKAARYNVSSDDDSSSENEDVDYLTMFANSVHARQQLIAAQNNSRRHLTAEEIEKNAEELITEEEKEKKRAEKRRAKKKRRREKKKMEKLVENSQTKNLSQIENAKDRKNKDGRDSSDSEDANFDASAAFFTQVNKKTKKGAEIPAPAGKKSDKKDKQKSSNDPSEQEVEDMDPVVLKSRQYAVNGNKLANQGLYNEAIVQFTEAMSLDPTDFRFFGNRSYCYDRMGQFEKALKDADRAIYLSSEWPKGYFRKGRALAGLKLYVDAEQAFMQVLKLDHNCEDAMQELLRVRTYQITEMGFSRSQAEAAIKRYGSVQQALDSLLAGVVAENTLSEVYVSDEEEGFQNQRIPAFQPAPVATGSKDTKMDPCNPDGLTALWVGNVLPEVKEKTLMQLFQKYGAVTSVRTLPEKFCAFVNFKTTEGAGKAMKSLQGVECGGQRLLIKFPDNPVTNGHSTSYVVRKNTPAAAAAATTVPAAPVAVVAAAPTPTKTQQLTKQQQQQIQQQKMSGPVNGDECYFWRTTGCQFGSKCHYRHIPENKGVDKKAWQRVK